MRSNKGNVDNEKEKEKKKETKPKIPIKVIFRVIGLKALSFGPICLVLATGCLIGIIGYYSLSALYSSSILILGISHLLFAVLAGPLILLLIFLFASLFCLFCCLRIRRLPKREVVLESEEEFGKDFMSKESMVYSFTVKLIYLGYFWMVGHLLPFGLLVPFNRFLGAKIGKNVSVIAPGTILDPELVEIGDNTIIGGDAIISGHVAEFTDEFFSSDLTHRVNRIVLKRVKIGKNCLIGARSFIWPGVAIENNVTVGSGAIVLEDTYLPANSVWVGVPAKRIK
jgi:Carbonic anhydrases/acetyltransferases, isoleucine patch superfamily